MGEDWYGSYDNDLKYLLYRYEEYLAAKAGEKVSEDIWEKSGVQHLQLLLSIFIQRHILINGKVRLETVRKI